MIQPHLTISSRIAELINATETQVTAAVRLLDEGATVPFIARYRKEVTKGLSDTQLRLLVERLAYWRELDERRGVVLQSIGEQGLLTPELEQVILAAESKTRLEDLYLPYRPKRRTKATLAKEAGLEPLALALLADPSLVPEQVAADYLNPEAQIVDVDAALEGARQLLMEQFAEEPQLILELRNYLWQHGVIKSVAAKNKKAAAQKFSDYFNYEEPVRSIPSHRALALFRGRRENALRLTLVLPDNASACEAKVASWFNVVDKQRACDTWLMDTVRLAWRTKLFTKLELELFTRLRELADEEAIRVFTENLRDLLLAAPAGALVTLGLDPGIRTGVKVVVIDETGRLLDYATVFPLAPHNEWHEAMTTIAKLAAKYHVKLISIGNGTGSRETERLVTDLFKMYPDLGLTKMVVSEAGASVYSASELASLELPSLDVTLRGAASIARRLQDPLSELVKIDPKAIGVGQYQHDVNQNRLGHSLDGVVEDCVNLVGVDVNRASPALLSRVAGLNEALAKQVVHFRDEHGPFQNRQQLMNVPRYGEKTFQQSAGFLRISAGENPLDASGVHPEAYPLVARFLKDLNVDLSQLLGNRELLSQIQASDYVDEQFGMPTVLDVIAELEKPGRDPRPTFKTVRFKEGVEDIRDLQPGMILEGVVSNVTNFGAFVDIGVHQDGLVHISAMTEKFIRDPRAVVKAGDIITVRVVEVDSERRRIGLSMKLEKEPSKAAPKPIVQPSIREKKPTIQPAAKKAGSVPPAVKKAPLFNTAMADALTKLKRSTEV